MTQFSLEELIILSDGLADRMDEVNQYQYTKQYKETKALFYKVNKMYREQYKSATKEEKEKVDASI